jgi:hypothetical protein
VDTENSFVVKQLGGCCVLVGCCSLHLCQHKDIR